jgi:hypothetical protein
MKTALLIQLDKSSKSDFAGSFNDAHKPEDLKWILVSIDSNNEFKTLDSGRATIEDMPVADLAIAIMAGQDVRLIELNLPLVNSKKIKQLLPNLIEDYLLTSPSNYLLHVLPPNDGASALLRTVAVINKNWHESISDALTHLNAQSIQIIPETLCLDKETLGYKIEDDSVSFTKRLSDQIGDSWSETSESHQETITAALSLTNAKTAQEITLEALTPGAIKLIDSHINLLAKLPKRKRAYEFSGHSNQWGDKKLWSNSIQWLGIFIFTGIIGLNSYFAALFFADWRWQNQMTEVAESAVEDKGKNSIKILLTETSRLLHINGISSVGDIDHLSSKIYLFSKSLGQDGVKRIQYNGTTIEFELEQSVDRNLLIKKIADMRLNIEIINQTRLRIYPLPLMKSEAN